ncbi:MAG: VWA domain-containing protein [Candidatus Altiarchaeota archaeon]
MNLIKIFSNNKYLAIIALLALLLLKFLWGFFGKIDDWSYSYTPMGTYLLYGGIAFAILFIWGIYSSRKNIKRLVIVLFLLIVPLFLIGGIFWQLGIFNMNSASSGNMGFSTGGAKDINNFRRNIENNYLPLQTDITYEGLFYEYFFDTGEKKPCEKLFCPSYDYAISKDPISGKDDQYLSVGLNSGIKEKDFKRKKLNLVVVLDMSGSMSSPFNRYYYDQFGHSTNVNWSSDTDADKSKMEVANRAVVSLLDHLNSDDRFGMVLYDDQAYLAKPLREVKDTDMDAIKGHVLEIQPRGGTYFEAGYRMGSGLFDDCIGVDQDEYENRIIFLTDAQPNMGMLNEDSLLGLTKMNSEKKVHTTFIGIGVDFNTELVEHITKIRGSNYYSVNSPAEFKTRMDNEFEYMVTPLVFNLTLKLDSKGYKIEKVYGSPEANESTGDVMRVNTLFPSKKDERGTKGGIVILKLTKLSPDAGMKLKVSYEDRQGKTDGDEMAVVISDRRADYYENNGVRKGVLLSKYADLMKNWINDERTGYLTKQPTRSSVTNESGIIVPQFSKWERQSIPLHVSGEYKALFIRFRDYLQEEMNEIGDQTLSKEVDIFNKLTRN